MRLGSGLVLSYVLALSLSGCSTVLEKDTETIRKSKLEYYLALDEELELTQSARDGLQGVNPSNLLTLAKSTEDPVLRGRALVALCGLGTPDQLSELITLFEKPHTKFEASLAIASVGRGRKKAIEFLVIAARRRDEEEAICAINALVFVDKAAALSALAPMIRRSSPHIRATVLAALKRIPSADVVELLIEMMDQAEAGMACTGLNTLHRIWIGPEAISEAERRTGASFGHYPGVSALITEPATEIQAKWRKWYEGHSYKKIND